MGMCYFCGRPEPEDGRHEDCYGEFERRRDAGKCGRCGRLDAERDSMRCADCIVVDDPPFVGYPPGGA